MDTVSHSGHGAGTLGMDGAKELGSGTCDLGLAICGQEHIVKGQ